MNEPGVISAAIGLAGILATAILSTYVARRKDADALLTSLTTGREKDFWTLVENLQEETARLETRLKNREDRVAMLVASLDAVQNEVQMLREEIYHLKRRIATLEQELGERKP